MRFVVIAVFVRVDALPLAKVGRSNPWAAMQDAEFNSPFTSHGLKAPFPNQECNPLFYLEQRDLPIGYVRVFDDYRGMAESWFQRLIDREDVWAFWSKNMPVGPLGEPEQYKSADQFVEQVNLLPVRAFTARGAAKAALKGLQASTIRSIKSYTRPN